MQLEAVQHTLTKHEFTIQKAKIVAYESGQGAPVLFLHGSPDSHDMWLPVMGYLNDHYRTIAPDLPGFGESTMPDGFSLTLDNMADVVRDLVSALGITEPVILAATDFGGHYGAAFLTKYPHLVRGMVISNFGFFTDYQWHFFARLYRVPLLGEFLLSGTPKAVMRQTLKNVSPAMPESYIESSYDKGFGSAAVRKAILRLYRERNPEHFAGWQEKLIKILETKPALVMWGDKDPFIDPAFGDRWGKAQVHHFKNNSHWLPLEAPEQYAQTMLGWMQGV